MGNLTVFAIATSLVLAACGDVSDTSTDGDDASPTTTEIDVTPTSDSTPPTTLELNQPTSPSRTSPPGDPVGFADPVFPEGDVDPGLRPFIDKAVVDLAARLDVDASKIETASATIVVWSDGAMGCPQPDMFYAQVLQDGSLIELRHGDLIYHYHSGGDMTAPFLCNQALEQAPSTGDAP